MIAKKIRLLVLLIMSAFSLLNCHSDTIENKATLQRLYQLYRDGDIEQCKYKGETVYSAGISAVDAGGAIYDKDGNILGTCNFAWGTPDPICFQLTDCVVIYRCKNHISNLPPVDLYGLGN